MLGASEWTAIGFGSFLVGAFACAVLGVWRTRDEPGPERDAGLAALAATALWCVLAAATGPESAPAAFGESLRNLAWLFFVYRLFSRETHGDVAGEVARDALAKLRPLFAALALVGLLHPALHLLAGPVLAGDEAPALIFHLAVMFRVLFATGALVLLHNLYVGSRSDGGRRWSAVALAAMWVFDLNFYTVAYLTDAQPQGLGALRGIISALTVVLLAVPGSRRADQPLRPSRTVAFQSLSLLVIGAYLVTMVAAAQTLAWFGDGLAPLAQIGFVLVSTVLALVVLPSGRLRGWMKVTIAKHFFQHRYDYRAEWLRFTQTIGRGEAGVPLEERIIQAVADITDSPAGLLLMPGEHGELALAARWRWRTAEVPAEAMGSAARRFFERDGFIVDLDRLRAAGSGGGALHQGSDAIPDWMLAEERAWALVPLLHFERLVGVLVLARPAQERQLDWEDFDLLRVVGRQLASYLAEHAGQEALLDASRFDEFNRRIAFVMHDIKNLASQLALLGRNAERHGENPEFRADMLVTVRNSADKLNALLARLSRYGGGALDRLEAIDPGAVAQAVVAARQAADSGQHRVELVERQDCRAIGNRETLEQVLTHLVQNAIDASPPDRPVLLRVAITGLHCAIEVTDSGTGMGADFVRNRLFKPFVSTKPGGFGIGAFEARELVRAMQGRLDVESREGLGSRFTVKLPIAAAAGLFRSLDKQKSSAGNAPDGHTSNESQEGKAA